MRNIETANAALAGMGLDHAAPRAATIETDDPFTLGEALAAPAARALPFAPSTHQAIGTPREMALQALRALRRAAGVRGETVALPALPPSAPRMSMWRAARCAWPAPASARPRPSRANPETPQLRFLEDACVQCGLCAATCPEKVITLEPRLNFADAAASPLVVKQEEPATCPRCAKAFGTRASIARVKAKLSAHWMFADPARVAILDLCDDCRITEATGGGLDPYAGRPARQPGRRGR